MKKLVTVPDQTTCCCTCWNVIRLPRPTFFERLLKKFMEAQVKTSAFRG